MPKPFKRKSHFVTHILLIFSHSSSLCVRRVLFTTHHPSLSLIPVDVTNADWEAGIYKERLVPLPGVPIIDAPPDSDEEEADEDSYFCHECYESSPFVMYCNQVQYGPFFHSLPHTLAHILLRVSTHPLHTTLHFIP